MYGLLLDTIQKFLREKYGENYWVNIRRRAKLNNHWFVTHEVYAESVITSLVDAASEELGEDRDQVMTMFGEYFAENIGRYGYARLLRVLGRDLRDFLNGLVDLHEYLRFSYPNMSPPSFFCSSETTKGLHLHYITKRKGFLCYVIGQMKMIGKIYGKEIKISVLSKDETQNGENYYIMDFEFDNSAMLMTKRPSVMGRTDFQIDSTTFFEIFPFSFVFSEDMVIRKVGSKLEEVLPGLSGAVLHSAFTLSKPYMGQLNWNAILLRTGCTFELLSMKRVRHRSHMEDGADDTRIDGADDLDVSGANSQPPLLKLKGQMMLLNDCQYIAFLCSPAMDSPEELYECGIFISDLSLHNCSREFIMAGSQKHPELNIAFSQERIRSAQLETSIKKTDELLYQMIPKSIADKLRNGEPPLNTCQEYDSVSILFSDIVSFTPMCSRLSAMDVVCVLNSVCTAYDKLCVKHRVYKVEMIGDAYMVLAGGPTPLAHHAESITNYGLGILEETAKIIDPSTSNHLRIRVGIHSGGVVAGVVGSTTQRYDVFGDTVNIAARMESTGEPMRIHISEATAVLLQDKEFIIEERGQVEVKGKGLMKTFWVDGRKQSCAPGRYHDTPSLTVNRTPPHSPFSMTQTTASAGPPHPRPRKSSPAPDEWPQAERRLSDIRHYQRTQRSHTLPNVDTSLLESELRYLLCPYDPARHSMPPLSPRNRDSQMCSPEHNHTSTTELDHSLVQVRQSLLQGLSTISEQNSTVDAFKLIQFAAMAEENAQNARRLADAAAEMVRSVQERDLSSEQLHDLTPQTDSSVDPPSLNQPRYRNYCTIL